MDGGSLMRWNKNNYPQEMKDLDEITRNKAIDIANILLHDDYDESRSIAMAICQAKQWSSKIAIIKSDQKMKENLKA